MSKPTTEIVLPDSGYKATLRTGMSYGEHRSLQQIMLSKSKVSLSPEKLASGDMFDDVPGDVLLEYNFKRVLMCLKEIKDKDGKEIAVTEDFLNNLSKTDGEFLEKAVGEVFAEKKKE